MTRFSSRSSAIELMDDLDCSGEVVDQTLRELEVINRLLGGDHVTLDGVQRLLPPEGRAQRPLAIVDLGCGGGDMLKKIAQWGIHKKIPLQLIGVDANPNIIKFAEGNSSELQITYFPVNIFSKAFRDLQFDIAIATLFFHHFSSRELSEVLRHLRRQAKVGIVINDIHRHWLAYYSIRFLTFLFSKSSMVRYDAPLSVLRAFSKKELKQILKEAGITHYELRWKWAFRWQVIIPSSLA